jgi:hypothetical protein
VVPSKVTRATRASSERRLQPGAGGADQARPPSARRREAGMAQATGLERRPVKQRCRRRLGDNHHGMVIAAVALGRISMFSGVKEQED